MTARGKYIIVYVTGLFLSPFPLLLPKPGTAAFGAACAVFGFILAITAWPLFRLEWRSPSRTLLRNKLVATTIITGCFGLLFGTGALVWLVLRLSS